MRFGCLFGTADDFMIENCVGIRNIEDDYRDVINAGRVAGA